jgi:hypothetical protein
VQTLVEGGHAQAICGNHELNLLRAEHKHGNHWFYGESTKAGFSDSAVNQPEEWEPILRFFRSLPVALERSDVPPGIIRSCSMTVAQEPPARR